MLNVQQPLGGSYDGVKFGTDLGIDNEGAWTAVYEPLHQAVSHVVLSIAAQFPSLQVWPLRYIVSSFVSFDIPAADQGS
jgi:hypothetical protein